MRHVKGICVRLMAGMMLGLGAMTAVWAQSTGPSWILRHQRAGGVLWSVASSGTRLVAVGTGGRILVSFDGVVWEARPSGVTDWLVGVTYGRDRFVAVGDNGRILISRNGDEWTPVANVPTTTRLNNVAFSNRVDERDEIIVAVGEAGTALVSRDLGATWLVGSTGGTGWLRGLTYVLTRSFWYAPFGGGTYGLGSSRAEYESAFIACGQAGRILVSTDGLTWTAMNSGTTADLEAVAAYESYDWTEIGFSSTALALGSGGVARVYVGSVASFVGDMNKGYYGPSPKMPDYGPWNAVSLGAPADVRLRGLAKGGYLYREHRAFLLASGENGVVLLDRVLQTTGVSKNLVAGVYHQDKFYVVGEDETILQQGSPVYVSKLGNLSTRGTAGEAAGPLIGGVVIGGMSPKRVLVRAIGPGLAAFGIGSAMPQPELTATDTGGRTLRTNAGWADDSGLAAAGRAVGAFPLAAGSRDAALLLTLDPGNYTFIVAPTLATPGGTVLFEAYDADPSSSLGPRLLNVAVSGQIGTEPLIGGFVVSGDSPRSILVRGVGPTLRSFGVTDAVADSTIDVYRNSYRIAGNDDWDANANASQLSFLFSQVGAFGLDEGSKDAALLLSPAYPGSYTVVLSAKGDAGGRGLIEIYELP